MQPHCRLCGEAKTKEHFNDVADETVLQEFIAKLNAIKIDFINFKCDILPKTVCQVCRSSVHEYFKFFKKIEQTQIYLSHIYKSSLDVLKVDIKIENEDEYCNLEPNQFMLEAITHTDTNKNSDSNQLNSDSKTIKGRYRDLTQIKHKEKRRRIKLTSKNHYIDDKYENAVISQNRIAELRNEDANIQISWSEYNWACMHCQAKFESMKAVRDHSKAVHAICFGFRCCYCKELFNYFNPFVEHVRGHVDSLRLHCQFCNAKSASAAENLAHTMTHWSTSHICTLCGEMLPSTSALERHKKAYKKASLPQRYSKKKPRVVAADMSWEGYTWSCLDCSLTLPNVASLRAHTREVHRKCFAMKCADCLTVLTNHKQFVDHVTAHRECLKNYCPYCNIKLDRTDFDGHVSTHMSGPGKPCLGCGDSFPDSASLMRHKTLYEAPRVRGTSDAEDLTCGVCLKVFPNGFQLRNHKVIHNETRERDQICHTCGKAFFDAKTLTNHIRTHYTKSETCEICKKTFLTKQRLKVHISTHMELKHFVCNECGKRFRRKSQLRLHLASHSDVLPHKCTACGKCFRLPSYLKIHERQHSGIRPYTCEVCGETFNHWGNCNRHMLRKHGVTFAKTKITAHGKLEVNKATGEARVIDVGSNAGWYDEVMKPEPRGRKRKVVSVTID